jgi:hypothetical protein
MSILQNADFLLLQREQAELVQDAEKSYTTRADSVWAELAAYLASLPDTFDPGPPLERQERATLEVRRIAWEGMRRVAGVLNPAQLAILPSEARWLCEANSPPTTGLRIVIR